MRELLNGELASVYGGIPPTGEDPPYVLDDVWVIGRRPVADYNWGNFWAYSRPGWRNEDLNALRYDLVMEQRNEWVAEFGSDVIQAIDTVQDATNPVETAKNFLERLFGNSAEESEEQQRRLEQRIHQLESH